MSCQNNSEDCCTLEVATFSISPQDVSESDCTFEVIDESSNDDLVADESGGDLVADESGGGDLVVNESSGLGGVDNSTSGIAATEESPQKSGVLCLLDNKSGGDATQNAKRQKKKESAVDEEKENEAPIDNPTTKKRCSARLRQNDADSVSSNAVAADRSDNLFQAPLVEGVLDEDEVDDKDGDEPVSKKKAKKKSELLKYVDPDPEVKSLDSGEFSNRKVGADVTALMHRFKITVGPNAEEIARLQQEGTPVPYGLFAPMADAVANYCSEAGELVDELHLVIDGGAPPTKNDTAEHRRASKKAMFDSAIEMQKAEVELSGTKNSHAVTKAFANAVNPTCPEAKYAVKLALESLAQENDNITFYQAPDEAEAQLAKLYRLRRIDVVYCNDTDYLLYGIKEVLIYKTNKHLGRFSGYLYRIDEAFVDADNDLYGFSVQKLKAVSIISGNDFSDGIFKVGTKTAIDIVKKHWDETKPLEANVASVIEVAESMNGVEVPPDFASQFKAAWATFTHHRVFDPVNEQFGYLEPTTSTAELDPTYLKNTLGTVDIASSVCKRIASGDIHHSGKPWDQVINVGSSSSMPIGTMPAQDFETRSNIITRDRLEFEEEYNNLGEEQKEELYQEYLTAKKVHEVRIQQLAETDPEVVEWRRKEDLFEEQASEYRRLIENNDLTPVDEKSIIIWTMFVEKRMTEKHPEILSKSSRYVLKGTKHKNGTPNGREEDAVYVRTNRKPIFGINSSSSEPHLEATIGNRTVRVSVSGASADHTYRRLRRHDMSHHYESSEGDKLGKVTQRFIQYPIFFKGDAPAFLAEMISTKTMFILHGGGTGIVLNRDYNGTVLDPNGNKFHCMGISYLLGVFGQLESELLVISDAQTKEVTRQMKQNIPLSIVTFGRVENVTGGEMGGKPDLYTLYKDETKEEKVATGMSKLEVYHQIVGGRVGNSLTKDEIGTGKSFTRNNTGGYIEPYHESHGNVGEVLDQAYVDKWIFEPALISLYKTKSLKEPIFIGLRIDVVPLPRRGGSKDSAKNMGEVNSKMGTGKTLMRNGHEAFALPYDEARDSQHGKPGDCLDEEYLRKMNPNYKSAEVMKNETKVCPSCGKEKRRDQYSNHAFDRNRKCKSCTGKKHTRECSVCHKVLPKDESHFSKRQMCVREDQARCRVCIKEGKESGSGKKRKATKASSSSSRIASKKAKSSKKTTAKKAEIAAAESDGDYEEEYRSRARTSHQTNSKPSRPTRSSSRARPKYTYNDDESDT